MLGVQGSSIVKAWLTDSMGPWASHLLSDDIQGSLHFSLAMVGGTMSRIYSKHP